MRASEAVVRRPAQALVRSISCWTQSRYGKWIVSKASLLYESVLPRLLAAVLDNNKRVQEAACSAIATLLEDGPTHMLPYLDRILATLMAAFAKYQSKNMIILYDTLSSLVECAGNALSDSTWIAVLMPPLIEQWHRISDSDQLLFPLFEVRPLAAGRLACSPAHCVPYARTR